MPGTPVEVVPFGCQGEVLACHGGECDVALGTIRVTCPVGELRVLSGGAPPPRSPVRITFSVPDDDRLDLHALDRDTAIARLEQFLNRCFLQGSGLVQIIHGKGSGILREAIRTYLARHELVREYRSGFFNEGDLGVTIVILETREAG